MKKELFKLALHGLKGKKRSSLLTVIILTISFAAVLVTLCITGSIIKTNAEYRLNTYGAWYGAIPYGIKGDAEFLSTVNGIGEIGAATVYGQAVSKKRRRGHIRRFGGREFAQNRTNRIAGRRVPAA